MPLARQDGEHRTALQTAPSRAPVIPAAPSGSTAAHAGSAPVAISGGLPRRPWRRGWHLLGLATGLVMLPHGLALLARLAGYRRHGTLRATPHVIAVELRVALLGMTIARGETRLKHEAVAGVTVGRAEAAWPLLLGAVLGMAGILAGLTLLADGLLASSLSLSLAGAGFISLGIGLDLAVFAGSRFLASRRGVDVTLVGPQGPLVTLTGVTPDRATGFASAVLAPAPVSHPPAARTPAEHPPAAMTPAEHPPAAMTPAEHPPAAMTPAEHPPAATTASADDGPANATTPTTEDRPAAATTASADDGPADATTPTTEDRPAAATTPDAPTPPVSAPSTSGGGR